MIKVLEDYGNGNVLLSLENKNIRVDVYNYGCTIKSIYIKDKDGITRDVVLGYDTLKDYQSYDGYLGALVGRVANRIKEGTFELNGDTYHLPINNGPNSLHGGIKGFSYQTFDYDIKDDHLIFTYQSKDREEGYPGTMNFQADYSLENTSLIITYHATTDKDTLINITNHSYFNLDGEPTSIDEHHLLIHASHYAQVDKDGLVTGVIENVSGTPFDFKTSKPLKDSIYSHHEQIILGKGLDHPFLFDTPKNQVELTSLKTGITLTVSTTLPQAQIYTANYLDGRPGKHQLPMNEKCAVCIETQNMPDSIHVEENPTVILHKNDIYEETTIYSFQTKR